jgi:signal transduction histidine kinase
VSDSIAVDLRRVAQIFFIISLLVGILLLVYNRIYSKDAEVRRQINVVLWGNVLGFVPYLIFVVLPYTFFGVQFTGGLTSLVFLVLVPLSYVYVIYQRKLLRVDFVINRFVVLFVLALLVLTLSILILGVLALVFNLPPGVPFLGGFVAALIALPSAALQRNVQVRVNRVLYGSHYDFSTVTAGFSSRLAVTLDRKALFELLTRDLSIQMGIQRAALFLDDGEDLALQPAKGETVLIPVDDIVSRFLLDARNPVRSQYLWRAVPESSQKPWREYDWGELFVPMVFEGQLHGILILGERVSAEVYSETDIQIIATIAYQGALAFENILLVETLRGLARQLVRTDEDQRRKVARDLHDAVLQDLFFVRQQLSSDQQELAGHISNIINHLRQTIKTQRTALLDQGLELALESLVVDMQSLARDRSQIIWNNAVDRDLNLTDEQATSIYRIVQEAIYNALKHAQAEYIHVRIENPTNDVLKVSVEDDGIGMPAPEGGAAWELHYGLVGMKERALMIGADLKVESDTGEGTMVTLEMKLCLQISEQPPADSI